MSQETENSADVLILGASFAGVELVYQLQRGAGGRALKIAVVDRQEEHPYIPLVHERLVGRIDPAATVLPTRRALQARGVRYVVGEIAGFDPERKEVHLRSGERLRGRFVVVALGSVLAPPPAIPGAEHFVGYKSAGEFADAARRLAALLGCGGEEGPANAGDADRSGPGGARPAGAGSGTGGEAPARPTIVVVGGGISGVELAGELAHLARVRPPGWRAPRVVLVHAGERLLPNLCARAGRRAAHHLERQGVELRLRARLIRLSPGTATLRPERGADEDVSCDMAFWSGGVRPAPILVELGLPLTSDGWLAVGPTLQCFPEAKPTRPEIFAIGDAARIQSAAGEWSTMQRAIECLWQAKRTARNIARLHAEPPDYPRGVPPLDPHVLREDFPHGVSVGGASLIVYGRLVLDFAAFNTWFRRFLMWQYIARYT
ncbi:MAG TPA: FAD-dependent oxidoreductase [Nannocystis sp.]